MLKPGFDVTAVVAGVSLAFAVFGVTWLALIGLSLARRMFGADGE